MTVRVVLDMDDLFQAITMYLEAQNNEALKGVTIEDLLFTDGEGQDIYPEEINVVLASA